MDSLVLLTHNPIEDWVFDSIELFDSTLDREIMHKCISFDFGKMCIVARGAMDVAKVGNVDIALSNESMWTLHQVRKVLNLKESLIYVR